MEFWEDIEKNEIGKLGMEFVQFHCLVNNIDFRRASTQEDRELGIDCYVAGVATDIKNTNNIYLGNYDRKYNKFFVRHPFKPTTKSIQYCITHIDLQNKTYSIDYLGNIIPYLSLYFIKGNQEVEKLIEIINSYDKKSLTDLKLQTVNSFLYEIKLKIMPLLKTSICNCKYEDYNNFKGERVPIYLYK